MGSGAPSEYSRLALDGVVNRGISHRGTVGPGEPAQMVIAGSDTNDQGMSGIPALARCWVARCVVAHPVGAVESAAVIPERRLDSGDEANRFRVEIGPQQACQALDGISEFRRGGDGHGVG